MEYIIRENNFEEMIPNFDGEILSDTLNKNYGYIYESMKANNYDIRFEEYSIFFELVEDEKVVGFVTYLTPQASSLALAETYVLPEFESKNLLFKNFLMLIETGTNLSIIEPTRDIVEFLVENDYATKLTDSVVTSAISFDMLEDDILGNFSLKGITPSTNLYDLNLCSPIFLYDISTPGVCEILYLDVLSSDDKKYNCSEFRSSINLDEYFNNIKKSFLENTDEFNKRLVDLKDSLQRPILDYAEIIGEGDELSDYFEGLIEDKIIDEKTAVKIRNQLKKEYENGEVSDRSLSLRTTFLLSEDEHIIDMETYSDVNMQFDSFCPYCYSQVSLSDAYCRVCGYNVSKTGTISLRDIKK